MEDTTIHLNDLSVGSTYRATTRRGATVGEYLGLESPHGDLAVILRHPAGDESIEVRHIEGLVPEAA